MNTRRYFVVILCAALSTSLLFMLIPSRSSPGIGDYNPWADINNDGIIDIYDAILLANAFNKQGQNLTKGSVMYDSGWLDITSMAGQYITITHGLNITDWNSENIDVSIIGKTSMGGELQRHVGLSGHIPGWNKTYGGTGMDEAIALVGTADGGYALAGWTTGVFWLVKTDASGNSQWNKTYGETGGGCAWAVVQTSDGGYALAGWTNSVAGWDDFCLVKTDSNGNMQWNKTYGGTGADNAYAMVQTGDGGYALAGHTTSFGAGSDDFWLVKTDANGNMQWNKTYGGTGYDIARPFVQTSDGGYALAGYTSSLGAGAYDFWLVKTDANGNMQWNKTYGGTGYDVALALVRTTDGGYALAGYTDSFGAGNTDSWLVKTDSNGNAEWNKTYGGTGYDIAPALVQTSDGGYALAGYTDPFGFGNGDAWLIKTDANGDMQWNTTYGGTGDDRAGDLVQTVDGGYALAGYTSSLGAGGSDFWLVKTDTESGARESGLIWVDSSANTITLYRGTTDSDWNFVRVRLWQARQTP